MPFRLIGKQVTLTDQQAHRVRHVLRAQVGDRLLLFDPFGNEWVAEVEGWDADTVWLQLVEPAPATRERSIAVTLFQGLPKGEKMDFIVQKTTELGVRRIVPMITQRTVVRLEPERAKAKQARWQRVAAAATEQSGGRFVPEVALPVLFPQAVKEARKADAWLLFYEAAETPLREALQRNLPFQSSVPNPQPPSHIAIMIGPEGGFAPEEVTLAQREGALLVGLGKRILRTETAAVVAVALVLYELDALE